MCCWLSRVSAAKSGVTSAPVKALSHGNLGQARPTRIRYPPDSTGCGSSLGRGRDPQRVGATTGTTCVPDASVAGGVGPISGRYHVGHTIQEEIFGDVRPQQQDRRVHPRLAVPKRVSLIVSAEGSVGQTARTQSVEALPLHVVL